MSAIDHLDLRVRDLAVSTPFYDAFLTALGFKRVPHAEATLYLRFDSKPFPVVGLHEDPKHVANENCFAFGVASREEVDRVAAALPPGTRDVEGPMPCPEYTADFYAVFFRDPDGNRLEVVSR